MIIRAETPHGDLNTGIRAGDSSTGCQSGCDEGERMGSFSENHIDSYERKVPVYQIHRLCQEGRIVFPSVPLARKQKRTERISETVEAILLGITLKSGALPESRGFATACTERRRSGF